jgi:hypothetical protein
VIAPNLDSFCEQAESYYYDFISKESRALIPGLILTHIKQCHYCQDQILQLESVLSQYENLDREKNQARAAIAVMLKRHFAYIGKDVTCEIVRPFLPTLLDPALEVRVPTPITVHLDHCQQCAQDLEIIRSLQLSGKQLCRLSKLFAAKSSENGISCSQAHTAIMAFVLMAFSEIDKQILNHLCTCYYCRKVLYQYRETVLSEHLHEEVGRKCVQCDQVLFSDIFDYVVPYELDSAHDQYAKFRSSFISHLRCCPTCLAKIQLLHVTVYGIIERANSGTVTIYHIDEAAEALVESDELYSGFPIRVEVLNSQRDVETAEFISGPTLAASKEEVSKSNRRPLFKTGIAAAAAVFIIAFLFLISMPTAKAVTISQIYKAIEKIQNVYISKFAPNGVEPIEEKWISRSLNIYITKIRNELVLWDLSNKVRKTKQVSADLVEATLLSDSLISEIEKRITDSLGLMPFDNISNMPAGTEWKHVKSEDIKDIVKGSEVYDLTWIERKYGGSAVFIKWRIFIDSNTNLPRRIEWYQRSDTENEYTLTTLIKVEYLSDGEVQTVIEKASF